MGAAIERNISGSKSSWPNKKNPFNNRNIEDYENKVVQDCYKTDGALWQ